MLITEKNDFLPHTQAIREHTHQIQKVGRSGMQQYLNNGFGKTKNTDFEQLHYQDI